MHVLHKTFEFKAADDLNKGDNIRRLRHCDKGAAILEVRKCKINLHWSGAKLVLNKPISVKLTFQNAFKLVSVVYVTAVQKQCQ